MHRNVEDQVKTLVGIGGSLPPESCSNSLAAGALRPRIFLRRLLAHRGRPIVFGCISGGWSAVFGSRLFVHRGGPIVFAHLIASRIVCFCHD